VAYSAVLQPVFDFVVFRPELIPESQSLPLLTVADYGPKVGLLDPSWRSDPSPESLERRRRKEGRIAWLKSWEGYK
jgi:hypothetical protein